MENEQEQKMTQGGTFQTGQHRVLYYDVMRILAIFLVLFNHQPMYSLYKTTSGWEQWICFFFTMLTRINVPLFLMVSGALLLGKNESWRTILKQRILRFLLVIIVFELGYNFLVLSVPQYTGKTFESDIVQFLRECLSGNIDGLRTYWFLYTYIGMLLMLPFLRSIAQRMRKPDFYVLLILHFLTSAFIPTVSILSSMAGYGEIALSEQFVIAIAAVQQYFYPLMGYYLDKKMDIKKVKTKHLVWLTGIMVVGILISSLCTIYEGTTMGTYTQHYVRMFDCLTTVWAFLMIKYMFENKLAIRNRRIQKIICLGGVVSFGIYLLDPYIKEVFYHRYPNITEPFLSTLVASNVWCIMSIVIGGSLTYALKKIPFMKKMI